MRPFGSSMMAPAPFSAASKSPVSFPPQQQQQQQQQPSVIQQQQQPQQQPWSGPAPQAKAFATLPRSNAAGQSGRLSDTKTVNY